MKQWMMGAGLLVSITAAAQQAQTNREGSQYQFTTIKQNDAYDVQSQDRTSTCWSFSGLSFFESELLRNGKGKDLNLSEMFVVRKVYPLKAANYVRMHGKNNFDEGGGFPDDLLVLRRYGLVPQEAYDGNRKDVYNHGEMVSLLKSMTLPLADAKTLTPSWNKALEGVLDAYLGAAPEQFSYKGKSYTPQSFAKELGLNADDYVIISSFSHHPFYSQFVLEVPDNWNWEKVYNVPLADFTSIAEQAVQNGYTLAWAADVSEKGFSHKDGLAIVPEKESADMFTKPTSEKAITQEMRQLAFDNFETQDDHGMHITGLVKDQQGNKYFVVKNSWGKSNYCGGYFYASMPYFAYKTTCFMVNKKAIPAAIAKKMGL
ncbi:aminopeptidase C [Chitinophaga lutea]